MAVVDASVVVAALVDSGEDGRWAEGQILAHDLAGPHLVLAEASNILRRAGLSQQLSGEGSSLAHSDLLGLDIELFPFKPFAPRVWQMRENVTAYDGWYLALAEGLECSLLTLDRRLARTPGIECDVRLPRS